MSDFKDWCGDVKVVKTGLGHGVRIDGSDVFDPINEYGVKTLRSFDLVTGLESKEDAQRWRAEWLRKQLAMPEFAAPAAQAVEEDSERAKFEAQYTADALVRDGDEYLRMAVQMAWEGWLARAALAAPVQPDCKFCGDTGTIHGSPCGGCVDAPVQSEQEPFKWLVESPADLERVVGLAHSASEAEQYQRAGWTVTPMFTAAPE